PMRHQVNLRLRTKSLKQLISLSWRLPEISAIIMLPPEKRASSSQKGRLNFTQNTLTLPVWELAKLLLRQAQCPHSSTNFRKCSPHLLSHNARLSGKGLMAASLRTAKKVTAGRCP